MKKVHKSIYIIKQLTFITIKMKTHLQSGIKRNLALTIFKISLRFSHSQQNPIKMSINWVQIPKDQCEIICPEKAVCIRPEEFTEPIFCANENFKFPNDLLRDPRSCQISVMMIGISVMLLFQVCSAN
jgi:hypothetical protein